MCGVVTVHVCNHTSIWLKAYLTLETLISFVPSTLPYAFDMSIMVKATPNYDAQVESSRETSRNAKKCAILATTENQNEETSEGTVVVQLNEVCTDADPALLGSVRDCKDIVQPTASAKRFQLLPPREKKMKVPRAADLKMQAACSMEPLPPSVRQRLGTPDLVIGFDVESHDWIEGLTRKGNIGPFGWYGIQNEMYFEYPRVVQVGWAIGDLRKEVPVQIKSRFVKPIGFQISAKATEFHSITQEKAECDGIDAAIVLREFLDDVRLACRHNGRVVAHHLEFDAGMIDREFQRCGLKDLREEWQRIAKNGYCTMNPELGRWIRILSGREVGPDTAKHCQGLRATMQALLPSEIHRLSNHHDSGCDADLARAIYTELLNRSKQ